MKIKIVFLFLVNLCFSACLNKPLTKEHYFIQYNNFIKDVELYHASYDTDTWYKKDLEYKKYSRLWYQEFRSSMSLEEKAKVVALNMSYHACKVKATGSKLFQSLEDRIMDLENGIH
jgi:hypothetical protein